MKTETSNSEQGSLNDHDPCAGGSEGATPMDDARPNEVDEREDGPVSEPESEQRAEPRERDDVSTAESELESLRLEVAALRDEKLRLLAEQRNQQQRFQREKAQALRYAESEFARELLVVLDDLERTIASTQEASDAATWVEGVRIVYEHFLKILRAHHIEPIAAEGQAFDPDVHEAMMQQPSDEHAPGTVIKEIARGYRMHDRVLRASRVIVSSGPAEGKEA